MTALIDPTTPSRAAARLVLAAVVATALWAGVAWAMAA